MTNLEAECEHLFGVGPEFDGSVKYYRDADSYSPLNDVMFTFCPFCGVRLTEESEENSK